MRSTEYSSDGSNWFATYSTNWKFGRVTDELPVTDKKGLEEWLTNNDRPDVRIEYSTDGGKRYVQFRRKFPSEDAGRITTFLKMHYKVRSVEIIDMSIQNAISSGGNSPGFHGVNTKPIHVIDKVSYIYNDGYEWKWSETAQTHAISIVTQHIPLSMDIRNTNEVTSRGTIGTDAISRGHIYLVTLINSLDQISQEERLVFENTTTKPITDYALVISPRSYDEETSYMTGDSIYAASVLSKKWFVDNRHNQFKIGPRFFINKAVVNDFVSSVQSYGGMAYVGYKEEQLKTKDQDLVEVIMSVQDKLIEAEQSGDLAKLTTALFEAMEFRNKAVDQLTALNETIKEARQKALAMVSNSGGQDS